MELVRGKAGRAIGRLTGFLTTMKGLPSGYNKDLQEDKEAVFDAEDTIIGSLISAAAVVETLTLKRATANAAAGGFMLATDVADYLVGRGMPFREAHEVVAGMVRSLIERDLSFAALTLEDWRAYSELFGEDVLEVTARRSVEARKTPQSTSPAAVADALADARSWLKTH
jgi:argininosuccinate lyase